MGSQCWRGPGPSLTCSTSSKTTQVLWGGGWDGCAAPGPAQRLPGQGMGLCARYPQPPPAQGGLRRGAVVRGQEQSPLPRCRLGAGALPTGHMPEGPPTGQGTQTVSVDQA